MTLCQPNNKLLKLKALLLDGLTELNKSILMPLLQLKLEITDLLMLGKLKLLQMNKSSSILLRISRMLKKISKKNLWKLKPIWSKNLLKTVLRPMLRPLGIKSMLILELWTKCIKRSKESKKKFLSSRELPSKCPPI